VTETRGSYKENRDALWRNKSASCHSIVEGVEVLNHLVDVPHLVAGSKMFILLISGGEIAKSVSAAAPQFRGYFIFSAIRDDPLGRLEYPEE
jgi:hypothetical protein